MQCVLWKIWSQATDKIVDSFKNAFCSWGAGTALPWFGSLPQAEGVLGQGQFFHQEAIEELERMGQ